MFQQPSQGDKVNVGDLLGSLVLVWVHGVREGIMTSFGEKEAVACDIHVLDGPKGGEKFINALIFQGGLIGSLRGATGGDPVLGRVGQGVSKPGQSPPYVLNPFTDADAQLATGYLQRMPKPFQGAANGGPTTTAPSATPAPAATAPAPTGTVDISTLPAEVQELIKQAGNSHTR
jgi:hypothetical protein